MKTTASRTVRTLLVSTASLLAAHAAFAQVPDTGSAAPGAPVAGTTPNDAGTTSGAAMGSEDIIVTARRRDETMLQVPVAITAVTAAEINRYAATDLGKIGQLVPQVILAKTGGGGAGASFTIRGIGSSALDAGIDQTVALNVDGLMASRGRLITQSFFDVAQVEILKGPQALFFGKNSPGGVVSVRTNGATPQLSGYGKVGYEFKADERFIEGAIAGPISDTLGFRIAARASEMNGYIKNTAGPITLPSDPTHPSPGRFDGRDPGTREILGRLTLEWRPTDAFDATLKLFGDTLRDNGETAGTELICDGSPRAFDLFSGQIVTDPYGDCKLNGRRSHGALNPDLARDYPGSNGGEPETRYKSIMSSLSMNYRLENVTLTSVTGYWWYHNDGFDNFSFDAVPSVMGANKDASRAFTQELRFNTDYDGPVNLAGGFYYERSRRNTRGHGYIGNIGGDPRDGRVNNWTLLSANRGTTYSAFGQAIWNILPELELAGGVRWTKERKRATLGNSFVNQNIAPLGLVAPEGLFSTGRFKDTNWSPEMTATYHPTPNTTVYAAYKTGYKSGGFSNPSILSPGQDADFLAFAPEKAKGGEIGFKGTALGGRLTFSSAIYRYKFEGLQLTSFNPSPPSFTIRNAASARTTGIEADATFRATPEFQLRLASGYNRAKYLNFRTAACYAGQTQAQGCNGTQDLSGTPLVRAPKWSVTGGASYDVAVGSAMMAGVSFDGNYTSGYWLLENQNPAGWQEGFVRLNATARLYEADDAWELALIGRNLTNKYYGVAGAEKPFGTPDAVWVNIGRPREILVQGTVRF